MKNFKLILCSLLCMACVAGASAQVNYIKTDKGKMFPVGSMKRVTTPDATPVVIDTLAIQDNSGGVIEVTCVGSSAAGDVVTGKLIYRYKKSAGTLTVASAANESAIVADTNVSGATFAAAATASNNLKITVTGKAGLAVKWRSKADLITN